MGAITDGRYTAGREATVYYQSERVTLYHARAEDLLAEMEPESVDLIVTDPPYFRVKGEWWDRQWNSADGFLEWLGTILDGFRRVLKPNGSLYVFASPQMARGVENVTAERFRVLSSIRWMKQEGWHNKAEREALRSFLSPWEAIIFAEMFGASAFSPLGSAIREARERAGMRATDVDVALGHVRKKDPTRGTELCRRWEEGSSVPSEDDFVRALEACGARRDFDALRREYDALRRPFDATTGPAEDVWDFGTVAPYPDKHPCEKPADLIAHVIRTSSREGDTVADFFMGSGVTAERAELMGRRFVGCDVEEKWCAKSRSRLAQIDLFPAV